jgi:hypothetical protein
MQLASQSPGARPKGTTLYIPLPPVELSISHQLPQFGAETSQLKVLDQQTNAHSVVLTFSGKGGETYNLLLRENTAGLKLRGDGATLGELKQGLRTVSVTFPSAPVYVTKSVQFSW